MLTFLLTIVPLESTVVPPEAAADFKEYLGFIFNRAIAIAIVLAVIMIAWGGLEYMFSQVPGIKSESKGRIWSAVGGLLLVLAAYLILQEINPDIIQKLQQPFQQIINQVAPTG